MTRILVLVPARHGSTRFPGKPLVPVRGPDGAVMSLLRRSWEAARAVRGVTAVHVATDDPRIRDEAESFGASAVMTTATCRNGSERCAEALDRLGEDADIVINFQGDAPLTPPWFVEALVACLEGDPGVGMATPVFRCDPADWPALCAAAARGEPQATTVLCDRTGNALCFSRQPLPWFPPGAALPSPFPVLCHAGIYAFRPRTLALFRSLEPGPLELLEGLEQLRLLEHGIPVRCVVVTSRGLLLPEVNFPGDVQRVEAAMQVNAGQAPGAPAP